MVGLLEKSCAYAPTNGEGGILPFAHGDFAGIVRPSSLVFYLFAIIPFTTVRFAYQASLGAFDLGDTSEGRLDGMACFLKRIPFYFTRVFKAEVGESPARYLTRRRAERAVESTRAGDDPLAEIAYRTGFSSQSHMTRRITEATGVTPGNTRSERRTSPHAGVRNSSSDRADPLILVWSRCIEPP